MQGALHKRQKELQKKIWKEKNQISLSKQARCFKHLKQRQDCITVAVFVKLLRLNICF